jgi:hypothetical protein
VPETVGGRPKFLSECKRLTSIADELTNLPAKIPLSHAFSIMAPADKRMKQWLAIDHLDVERLLADWRWLLPNRMTLVARNAFGDMFLRDDSGAVFRLDVAIGKLTTVAESEPQFRELAATDEKREEWFAEADEQAAAERGLKPDATQCIGFSVPLVFSQSGSADSPYVADLYEHVSFLGDVNRQISSLPDGAKVRLVIEPRKQQ